MLQLYILNIYIAIKLGCGSGIFLYGHRIGQHDVPIAVSFLVSESIDGSILQRDIVDAYFIL